jgi:hypothetical protein
MTDFYNIAPGKLKPPTGLVHGTELQTLQSRNRRLFDEE